MSKNEDKFSTFFKNIELERENRIIDVKGYVIKTSFDFSFQDKGITYLIEIDSYNMAKCILGQYVLINHSSNGYDPKKTIFVSVHYYKNYNTKRTENHLQFAKNELGCKIPFAVFHIGDLLQKDFDTSEFVNAINQKLK